MIAIQTASPQQAVYEMTGTSGLAVASMVIGIVSLFLVCIPFVGFAVAGLGLLLGCIAAHAIKTSVELKGMGFAATGIVLNVLTSAWGLLFMVGCMGVLAGPRDKKTSSGTKEDWTWAMPDGKPLTPEAIPKPKLKSTSEIELKNLNVKVTEKNDSWWRFSWKLDATNNSNKEQIIRMLTIEFLDSDGFIVDTDYEFRITLPANSTTPISGSALVGMPEARTVASTNIKTR